jgi:hypothetical protein
VEEKEDDDDKGEKKEDEKDSEDDKNDSSHAGQSSNIPNSPFVEMIVEKSCQDDASNHNNSKSRMSHSSTFDMGNGSEGENLLGKGDRQLLSDLTPKGPSIRVENKSNNKELL